MRVLMSATHNIAVGDMIRKLRANEEVEVDDQVGRELIRIRLASPVTAMVAPVEAEVAIDKKGKAHEPHAVDKHPAKHVDDHPHKGGHHK